MWPQYAKSLAIAGNRADRVIGGAVAIELAIVLGRAVTRSDMAEGRIDVGIAELGQTFAGEFADRNVSETAFHVTAMGLDVNLRQGFDDGFLCSS